MKIYFITPIGHKTPLLFDTMIPTFIEQGHDIVDAIKDADVVFFDVHGDVGVYDDREIKLAILFKKRAVIFDDIDYGGMSDKYRWIGFDFQPDAITPLAQLIKYCKPVYFMRKMDETLEYPEWVYPYELIQYPDCDFPPVSREELMNRTYDICFIGNASPTRLNVTNGLREHFKCDFLITEDRMPHEKWLNRHRQAKMFLTADGGGFSDERPYQLITIAAMLKVKNNHLQRHLFDDINECLEVSEHPTGTEIQTIKSFLSSERSLYKIYENGMWCMAAFYSASYRANYILETLRLNGID